MKEAVLAFGSNLGDREKNIQTAISLLQENAKVKFLAISDVYETEPFEVPDEQPNYLNCCAKILTALSPGDLLDAVLSVEEKLGHRRTGFRAARTLDIDLILYEGVSMDSLKLTLPHPEFSRRGFVLWPLADLYPVKVALGVDFSTFLSRKKLLKKVPASLKF